MTSSTRASTLKLRIISLDSERHRLGLSLKQAEDAPARPIAEAPMEGGAPAMRGDRVDRPERAERPERGDRRGGRGDRERTRSYSASDAVQEPEGGIDTTLAAAFAGVREQLARAEAGDAEDEVDGVTAEATAEAPAADATVEATADAPAADATAEAVAEAPAASDDDTAAAAAEPEVAAVAEPEAPAAEAVAETEAEAPAEAAAEPEPEPEPAAETPIESAAEAVTAPEAVEARGGRSADGGSRRPGSRSCGAGGRSACGGARG